ncbi:MAG: hypothetical protein LBR11_07920 [Deltaproteobacteria bacterium]|nr:hypothetical protein [Deltaproteobacteria bacterium]
MPEYKVIPLNVFLSALCAQLDKDLVIFFYEDDSLLERPLLSFLSQLRIGYVERDNVPLINL